jgi:flagellar basal body-associated protein FliL
LSGEQSWKECELRTRSLSTSVLLLATFPLLLLAGCRELQRTSSAEKPKPSVVHLETFVLNAGDTEAHSFLKIGIDLVVQPSQDQGADSSGGVLVPAARDAIIGVLTSAKSDDLLLPAGKAKLKADLLKTLQDRLPAAGIHDVYFTEFLIQR